MFLVAGLSRSLNIKGCNSSGIVAMSFVVKIVTCYPIPHLCSCMFLESSSALVSRVQKKKTLMYVACQSARVWSPCRHIMVESEVLSRARGNLCLLRSVCECCAVHPSPHLSLSYLVANIPFLTQPFRIL